MPRHVCPTEAELRNYLLGYLPTAAQDEIDRHLKGCPHCERAAEALDGLTDQVLTGLRTLRTPTPARGAAPGPQHIGRHEVLEVLGEGGMGIVYKARDPRLGRVVALKVMHADHGDDPLHRLRFRRETEVIARLQHPGIVQIFEVGEYDPGGGPPRAYFTQEFVEGGCLADRLSGRPQPPPQSAQWLEAIARAVEHAHSQGVVHRDLKPSNILLTADGRPKVCDFGVAKLLCAAPSSTASGTLIGTADYMAPEQALGRSGVGPPADVHALGAVLYELLTGRPPFRGSDRMETVQLVIHQEPVPPRQLNPAVPADLDTICLKCLEKDPQRRYPGAGELAEDLRRFLEGRPIRARRVGWLARAWRWCGRHPREATLAGLAALAGFVAVAGWAALAEAKGRQARKDLSLLQEQADRAVRAARAVDEALDEVTARRRAGRDADPAELAVALSAARRAEALADETGDEGLRRRVRRVREEVEQVERRARLQAEQGRRDRRMLEALAKIQWQNLPRKGGAVDVPAIETAHRTAFRRYGLDLDRLAPSTAAARIRTSKVRVDLVTTLDGWALLRKLEGGDWQRLLAVARLADPDSVRNRLRDLILGDFNRAALLRLAEEARRADLPEATAELLGGVLRAFGLIGQARVILRRAQRRYPGNYWITVHLGMSYHQDAPQDVQQAIRFYTAARTLRRDPEVLHLLGLALGNAGRMNEAVANLQEALALQPGHAEARRVLANCLLEQGMLDEAVAAFRALVRQRGTADDFYQLGNALFQRGSLDEAVAALRQSVRLRPGFWQVRAFLGWVLVGQGKLSAARDSFRRAHALAPKDKPGDVATAAEALHSSEGLIKLEKRLPAFLRGEAKVPTGEAFAVAEMLASKGLNAAAARQLEEILNANPKLAEDRTATMGYRAARAAARAGCGQGKDAAGLTGAERARWRKTALGRLRQELEVWRKQPQDQPVQRLAVEKGVRTWLYEPALAGVREPARLAKLPAQEQKDWRRLWADVRKLLDNFRDDP
jgi:serine/threonine-protein kinase